jgi:dihydrolipoamide dehydrogenase
MATKLAIIGAGSGGYVAAIRAAQHGAHVTLIENAEVGGNCLNWGCIPTKSLVASAEALEHTRNAANFGVDIQGTIGYSLAKIRERKDKIISTQVQGIRRLLKSWGVSLLEGRGSLISPNMVRVAQKDGTTVDIQPDKIIIATGSRPAQLPGASFDGENIMSSDDAVLIKRIPKRMLIIGAGIIGCELAFVYRAFGSDVSMVEMMPRALSREDEDVASILEREFKKSKIKLLTNDMVQRVDRSGDGCLIAELTSGSQITAEAILVAIGRSLNSENLGLDGIGVATGKRGDILVNEKLETSVPGIYAIGDVTGKVLLAHVAYHQGLTAVENALGGDMSMDYTAVPNCIFTMPEIGSVGLREKDAIDRGILYRVGRFPYRSLGRSHAMGELTGMVKIVADEASDRVLGVHICGARATDMIHEGALAITIGATARQIGEMIHAHPTLSEAIMESAEAVHKTAIHLPKHET